LTNWGGFLHLLTHVAPSSTAASTGSATASATSAFCHAGQSPLALLLPLLLLLLAAPGHM
jgi:hypothetical protein